MSCEHEVRFTIKPTDDACRFHFDVRAYKDRIVAHDEYSGATEVTPSDSEQVLPTKDKTVRANITVNPAPTESLATSENGTFQPSSGNVGFSEVVVDVEPSLESLSVTENGLYLPNSGTDGFDRVTVSVPIPTFETEEKTVTENGIYLPSAGVDGISKVTVDVPETIPDLIPLTATANGQYTATGHDGFSDVTVDVPPTVPVLQGKAVNPSESTQHVEPDSGYDGLSAVDVGAIPSSYVGSGITRRSGSDLTASGNTVNVPSGYYESSGSKTVQSGSTGTPTASKSAVSNNAVTVTPSVSNTEGYISGGTKTGNAVTVSASELVSGTKQVSITANGTATEDVTAYANVQIDTTVVNEDYEDALVALGVTEDLTDSIEALTTYANGVTGESDTTLSDAVASLADGYGGGSGSGVKYSRYELTGDTTFKNLIDTIQYAPQDTQNCMLFFRVSGTVAPTTGSYTMNNYIFIIENGTVKGWNAYSSGKVTPNSVTEFPRTLQTFNDLRITNGILTINSTSTNCLGTTGDIVTIAEYPGSLALSLAKMNGGAL